MAAEEQQQDNSKTLVSFVVGLLIGGMLVWAFSGPDHKDHHEHSEDDHNASEMSEDMESEEMEENDQDPAAEDTADATPELIIGDGSVEVSDQASGLSVTLDRAEYPVEEGWIGVRDYNNGQLSFIKGVVRFSAAAGLVPENIVLQVPTQPGQEYAIVMFTEDGDNTFNPAGDVQIDQIFATFTAQ